MKIKTLLMAAAAGAAVAYFMDSERGAQRRAMAKERAEQLKAQALPKLQELRKYTTSDLPGGSEEQHAYASNGSGTPVVPS